MTEIIETIQKMISNSKFWRITGVSNDENSYTFTLTKRSADNEHDGANTFREALDDVLQYLAENEVYHELIHTEMHYRVILKIEKKDSNNKLYISVPTTGRTQKAIGESMAKMHKLAEAFFDRHLVVVDMNYELADGSLYEETKKDKSFKDVNFDILNQSLRARVMAGADYYILCDCRPIYKECCIDYRILDNAGMLTYIGNDDKVIVVKPTQIGKDILEKYKIKY